MQPGKTYRLRREGASTFEIGYFLDFFFYGANPSIILGHIDGMGYYIGRVPVNDRSGNPHRMLGRVVGEVLECLDGRRFELIDVDQEVNTDS